MTGRRVVTALQTSLLEYVRTPLLLVVLILVPADLVGVITSESVSKPIEIVVPSVGNVTAMLPNVIGTLTAPLAVTVVGGVLGLFVMQSARAADARLAIAGYRAPEIILARFGLLAVGCVLVVAVAEGILLTQFVPDRPWLFGVALLTAGLTYGMVGMVVGLTIDRLAGVYVMLLVPMIDFVLFQNPIGMGTETGEGLLPGHFVAKAAIDASFGSGFAIQSLAFALGYLAVLCALVSIVFYRSVTTAHAN